MKSVVGRGNSDTMELLKRRERFFQFLGSEIPFFGDGGEEANEKKYIVDNYGRIVETVRVLSRYLRANDRVLDLGVYPGHIALVLAKKMNVRVYGVALTTSEVFASKMRRSRIDIIKSDLDRQDLSFNEQTFQVVLCSEVIEHLDSPSRLIGEVHRVLVDNGILVLTTPNIARIRNRLRFFFHGVSPNICPPGEYDPFSSHEWLHVREYTLDEIRGVLVGNKFRVVESKYMINHHFDENNLRTKIKALMPGSLKRGIIVIAQKGG